MRKADLKEVYTLEKISDRDLGATVHSLSRYTQQDIDSRDEVIARYFLGQENHLYLLQTFAGSVSAIMNCFKLLGAAERALVILIFQFAKRVEENGCVGTDYGTTASLFVMNVEAEKSMTNERLYLTNFSLILLILIFEPRAVHSLFNK